TKVGKDEKVEENVSCCRYRLRPHRTQVQLLRQWFGVAREYYNATIEYLVKEKAKACFQDIRPIIKDKLDNAKSYRLQVPDKMRQGAIQDACRAMNNAKLKYQQDKVFSKLKFRTRRDPSQSIYMDKSAIKVEANAVVFYPQITKTSLKNIAKNNPKNNPKNKPRTTPEIRTTEPIAIKGACRVVMKHNRYFQLASPQIQQGYEGPAYGECASLDPGGRFRHGPTDDSGPTTDSGSVMAQVMILFPQPIPVPSWPNRFCSHNRFWFQNQFHGPSDSGSIMPQVMILCSYNRFWFRNQFHGPSDSGSIMPQVMILCFYNRFWFRNQFHGPSDSDSVTGPTVDSAPTTDSRSVMAQLMPTDSGSETKLHGPSDSSSVMAKVMILLPHRFWFRNW
ncbi:hypothetical protein HK102_004425, partial [Quaeritorhiza haematococci]